MKLENINAGALHAICEAATPENDQDSAMLDVVYKSLRGFPSARLVTVKSDDLARLRAMAAAPSRVPGHDAPTNDQSAPQTEPATVPNDPGTVTEEVRVDRASEAFQNEPTPARESDEDKIARRSRRR